MKTCKKGKICLTVTAIGVIVAVSVGTALYVTVKNNDGVERTFGMDWSEVGSCDCDTKEHGEVNQNENCDITNDTMTEEIDVQNGAKREQGAMEDDAYTIKDDLDTAEGGADATEIGADVLEEDSDTLEEDADTAAEWNFVALKSNTKYNCLKIDKSAAIAALDALPLTKNTYFDGQNNIVTYGTYIVVGKGTEMQIELIKNSEYSAIFFCGNSGKGWGRGTYLYASKPLVDECGLGGPKAVTAGWQECVNADGVFDFGGTAKMELFNDGPYCGKVADIAFVTGNKA